MTGNEYQKLAARTINQGLTFREQRNHALYGMVGEIGEIHSIYQKMYQGSNFSSEFFNRMHLYIVCPQCDNKIILKEDK
jgi:DNA-directed RNA polymerase subunit RPC12/RpoP